MQSNGREDGMSPEERRLLSEQNRGNAQRHHKTDNDRAAREEARRRKEEAERQRELEEAAYREQQAKMERLLQSERNRGKALEAQHKAEAWVTDEPWQDEYDLYDEPEEYDDRSYEPESDQRAEAYRYDDRYCERRYEDSGDDGYDDRTYDDYDDQRCPVYDDEDEYEDYGAPLRITAPVSGSAALADEPARNEETREEAQDWEEQAPDEPFADPGRIFTPAENGTKAAAAKSPMKKGTVTRGGRFNEKLRKVGNPNRITTGSAIVLGLLVILLLGLVIYGKVQTNEIYMKIASLQTERDDLIARNVSMRSEMEQKLTVKNVEDYAENVLGLKQLDKSQIEYICIQTEDEVTITEPQDGWTAVLKEFFSTFTDFLHGK